ncbi:glucosamine--fructose-6-phosphate aminotransferase [Sulfurirhabdus autotrophica]|uniref:Uncharacterized protein n=1 Tax=Sulfurirhabdus autotrophica TaxID=1706046 RepID=A0A4R3Y7X5_9PROT|nr:glucosamine--fructose-6-phosphate aminotransferase [Sulfurirhabdus autotrophica]TCV86383.1 hypothetical protein EDC63_10771 [Sulfurirhabdus autotrophica]
MPKLPRSLRDWHSDAFVQTLKNEIVELKTGTLPLHQGISQGGYVDDSNISATVLSTTETEHTILTKVGIFFTEIVICCGCGDDPMPQNAYCEMHISINKATAEAEFIIIQEAI